MERMKYGGVFNLLMACLILLLMVGMDKFNNVFYMTVLACMVFVVLFGVITKESHITCFLIGFALLCLTSFFIFYEYGILISGSGLSELVYIEFLLLAIMDMSAIISLKIASDLKKMGYQKPWVLKSLR